MKLWSPPEFFYKKYLTNNYLSCDPHFLIPAWVQIWNIFENLMKVCSPPEFFHENISHEQLLFTWSTFPDSSRGTKLKYFWKTHETVKYTRIFSQKHVSRTITCHVIHITLIRVLPVENAVRLHFYDPFIKMSLSETSFTGCNQPPRSVLLPECCRRCCRLCRNCYLVMKLVVFVNRGLVHAMPIVRSFSAMPQYQFFLYCSFRL